MPRPSATDSAKLANRTVINKIPATIPGYKAMFGFSSKQARRKRSAEGSQRSRLHHEHHRILYHVPGVQFLEAPPPRQDFRISRVTNFVLFFFDMLFSPRHFIPFRLWPKFKAACLTAHRVRCSAMGPRARAGKKVSAANIYTINIRTTIKVTVSVRRVPADSLILSFLKKGARDRQLCNDRPGTGRKTWQDLWSYSRTGCYLPVPQSRSHCWRQKMSTRRAPGLGRGSPGS